MSSKPPLMISPPSNNNGNTMESRTSDLSSSQVCVTLGSVPHRRSWCCPLQLGIPRGHWSGGNDESLWPCEPRIGLQVIIKFDSTFEISNQEWFTKRGVGRGLQRGRQEQRMGRRIVARATLHSCWSNPNDRWRFEGGICLPLGVRRGSLGMQPCHRLHW